MATKPTSKLNWVTDNSPAKISEPTSDKKLLGWEAEEKPPFQWFNWCFNIITRWMDYFETKTDELQTELDASQVDITTLQSTTATHTANISTLTTGLSNLGTTSAAGDAALQAELDASQVDIAANTTNTAANTAALALLSVPNAITAVSGNVTLVNKSINIVDTTAARILTLPAPVARAMIIVKDKNGTSDAFPITIARSSGGVKIENAAADLVIQETFASRTFVSDGTDWFII